MSADSKTIDIIARSWRSLRLATSEYLREDKQKVIKSIKILTVSERFVLQAGYVPTGHSYMRPQLIPVSSRRMPAAQYSLLPLVVRGTTGRRVAKDCLVSSRFARGRGAHGREQCQRLFCTLLLDSWPSPRRLLQAYGQPG